MAGRAPKKPWAHFFALLGTLSCAQCQASGREHTGGKALSPLLLVPALAPLSVVLEVSTAQCPLLTSTGLQGVYSCSGAGEGFPSQAQLQFGQELKMKITSTQIVMHL